MAGPSKPPRVNRDNFARTSFLYHAANYHLSKSNPILSRIMSHNMDAVSKRTVLKLSPHLKRTICKRCQTILVPGLTCTMEIRNKSKNGSAKADVLIWNCDECQTEKRFPVGKNRNYSLFCDSTETVEQK